MKLDSIIPLSASHAVRISAGAPVMRGGQCFAPVSVQLLSTCRCCFGSGWAPDEETED